MPNEKTNLSSKTGTVRLNSSRIERGDLSEASRIERGDLSEASRIEREIAPAKKSQWLRRLLQACGIGIVVVALICALIAFSTDFRQWTISKITTVANNFLLAEISINDIKFNRLQGVSIEGIDIITGNDTLANIKQAIIDISFESILYGNTIKINHIELIEPNIKLLRSASDSLWNYTKIVAPSDTPPDNKPATTIINVTKIIITNGKFQYWDSLANYPADFANVRPLQMKWQNLSLNATDAVVDLANPLYSININKLSGKEANSLDIKELALNAKLTPDGIEANDCRVSFVNDVSNNVTDISNINFDASMTNYNIFGQNSRGLPPAKTLGAALLCVSLNAENFNPKWIDNFVKLPIRFGRVKQFEIQAKGTLNDMFCKHLALDVYNSHLNLYDITLTHLTTPQKLSYTGLINSTMLKREDLQKCLQSIDLSAVPNFVQAYIMNTKFFGTTGFVQADLDLRTGLGSVKGGVELAFAKKTPTYNVNLETQALNIGAIINNPELSSNINCKVDISGNGFNINKLGADVVLDFTHSKITDFAINNTKIDVNIAGGDTLIINDFMVNFVESNFIKNNELGFQDINTTGDTISELQSNKPLQHSAIGTIHLAGGIGLKNIQNPFIDMKANLQGLQLDNILRDSTLPQSITSDIRVQAAGIDIYNTLAKIDVDVSEIYYNDKSVLPFSLAANIDNDTSRSNNISLTASSILGKMFDINVNGHFTIPAFSFIFQRDMEALKDFYHNRISSVMNRFNKHDVDTIVYQAPIIRDFKMVPTDMAVKIDVQNLGFLSFLLDSVDINRTVLDADLHYKTSRQGSVLNVNSLNINTFNWDINNNKIVVNDLSVKSMLNIPRVRIDTSAADSNRTDTTRRRFKKQLHDFSVDLVSHNALKFNDITLDSVLTRLQYHDSSGIRLDINGRYNRLITGRLHGKAKWNQRNLEMLLDTFRVNYANNTWHNDSTLNFRYGRRGFIIRKFEIIRDGKERLSLAGRLSNDTMTNIRVRLNRFNIADLNELVLKDKPLPVTAMADSISLVINGILSKPVISSSVNVSNIRYENAAIGSFVANMHYKDDNVSGNASIKSHAKVNNELFLLDLRAIPLHIGLNTNRPLLIEDKPMDMSVKINDLQAGLLSPFIPSISNINGKLRGVLNIGGYLPDKYEYSGNVGFENLQFKIDPINMQYTAFGNVELETGLISFKNLRVKNSLHDLRNGELMANGKIEMPQLTLKHIDIEATTRAFQILGEQTATAMPWFFGKIIIATGDKPLRFHGTMAQPNLSGSVEIVDADVKMPQILNDEIIRREQKFNYINKDTVRWTLTSTIDSAKLDSINQLKNSEQANPAESKSIVDLLNIDLAARIKRFTITLDMGTIGTIFAKVGTKVPNTALRYVKERTSDEAKLYGGELAVLDGSTVQMYRTMSARGSISFPTARVSRPSLNLIAEYRGRINSERSGIINYSVFVNVMGSPPNPQVELSYSVNGNMVAGDKAQIQSDAFAALTQGVLRGYNDAESTGVFDELGTMFVSQIASKTLTDLLLKTGIIQSANIKFDDDSFNSANVSVSGMLSGIATWTFGGKIQDIASNYSFSVDIPINIDKKALNTIMLQLNRDTYINNSEFDRNAKNWEINLNFNGHW